MAPPAPIIDAGGADRIVGTVFGDVIIAGSGADEIKAGDGVNKIQAQWGDDLVRSGEIPRNSTVLYAHLGGQPLESITAEAHPAREALARVAPEILRLHQRVERARAGGRRRGAGERAAGVRRRARAERRVDRGDLLLVDPFGPHDSALDLTNVGFMDSSSLGTLVTCLKRVRERDGQLVLVGVTGSPMKVFTLTGLDRVFDIVPSRDRLPAG